MRWCILMLPSLSSLFWLIEFEEGFTRSCCMGSERRQPSPVLPHPTVAFWSRYTLVTFTATPRPWLPPFIASRGDGKVGKNNVAAFDIETNTKQQTTFTALTITTPSSILVRSHSSNSLRPRFLSRNNDRSICVAINCARISPHPPMMRALADEPVCSSV